MDNNTAVITTKYILEQQSSILIVYHDIEGDWQFMGEEDVTEEDAKVVSLKQIMDIDISIMEVMNLEAGHVASRRFIGDKWTITQDEFES